MNLRIPIKALSRKYYPKYKSPYSCFTEEAQKIINANSVVLHVGCGADESIGLMTSAKMSIGVDLDNGILNNSDIDLGIIGDIEQLPIANQSVDVIISRWVIEHLKNPLITFYEAERVLKDGGVLIVLGPNRFHYSGFVTSMTPHWLQRWFVKTLLSGDPDGVFPTYYRANSILRLHYLAKKTGLSIKQIQMIESEPILLGFSRTTYLLGVLYERIVNSSDLFGWLRSAILITFNKPF